MIIYFAGGYGKAREKKLREIGLQIYFKWRQVG